MLSNTSLRLGNIQALTVLTLLVLTLWACHNVYTGANVADHEIGIQQAKQDQLPDSSSWLQRLIHSTTQLGASQSDEKGQIQSLGQSVRWASQSRESSEQYIHDGPAERKPETKENLRPFHNRTDLRSIPQYIFDHAPLVYLHPRERFWPCDMGRHLFHVTPKLNYTSIQEHSPNLTELDGLNEWNGGHYVYLTSDDDPEEVPSWLSGEKNIPNGQPLDNIEALASSFLQPTTSQAILQSPNSDPKLEQDPHLHAPGHSHAPAILVVVPKANNITDAFWFYFYSFNLGNTVLNVRFGNHVGDWEHSMVRFENGVPTSMFFSEHIFGTAYLYEAVEKKRVRAFPAEQQPTTSSTHHDNRDKKEEEDEKVHENREAGRDTLLRPVVYSAAGTHANYATPGRHTYVLPFGLLHDETGRGPLWDPSLNAHAYTYDFVSDRLFASTRTPDAPTEWFDFAGHWGDRAYARDDPRQYEFVGQLHYVSGPLGPRFKDLRRERVCPGRAKCVVRRNRNEEGWRVWEGEGGDLEEGVD